MSDVADYNADILLWSERQAALLRGLKNRARNLPNELDLENVAEEIESVGRSELGAASSLLTTILVHLIKIAFSSKSEPVPHWLDETRAFHDDLLQRLSPSMLHRIDFDRIWLRASRRATQAFEDHNEQAPSLPVTCPLSLLDLTSENFEPRSAAKRLSIAIHGARSE